MAYSITTKDGLTINGIPDDMPPDAPELKQRVAALRGTPSAPIEPAAPKIPPAQDLNLGERAVNALPKTFRDWLSNPSIAGVNIGRGSTVHGVAMGNADIPVGAAQLAANYAEDVPGIGAAIRGAKAVGFLPKDLPGTVNKAIQQKEQEYEQARQSQGRDGFDAARVAGAFTNPATWLGGEEVAAAKTVPQMVSAGAKIGAVYGGLSPVTNGGENFTSEKLIQAGSGALSGAVMTPAAVKAGEAIAPIAQKAADAVRGMLGKAAPTSAAPNVDIAAANTLRAAWDGDISQIPQAIQDSVKRQISEAFAAGQKKLDPAAIMRKAQFEAVGLTDSAAPTLGQMTRDPVQFAQEKNLSGTVIKTPTGQGNPLADRFAEQNKRLQEVFNLAGAGNATDRVTAGQTIIDGLKAADAPVKAGVDQAYSAARDMAGGRVADLERHTFSEAANNALDEGMLNAFVPSNVRTLLNDITAGKGPFNVESAVQIDTLLSKAQRQAERGGDDAGALAVGKIREALHNTPLAKAEQAAAHAAPNAGEAGRVFDNVMEGSTTYTMQGRPEVNEGQAARDAFDQARRAARSRFATIEQTPALKAALDEVAPDKFVQNYILNANVKDLEAMKKVLENSPEALAQARAQIAEHLKHAAFGANGSGDNGFAAARYLETLRGIGRKKLEVFFDPAEIVRLNLAGKVASDINSIPVGAKYGVNSSGTGAAVLNALQAVAESPLLRKIPGARMISNQAGEIRTERMINQALLPKPGEPVQELSPEVLRAIGYFGRGAAQTGGLLGGTVGN